MQIQSDLRIDRLNKISTLIEANCEYITNLNKCITEQQSKRKQSYPKLQQYLGLKKSRINEESFLQTFIQIAYFIFSCRRYNIKPAIGADDIRIEEFITKGGSQIRFNPIIWYSLNEEESFEPLQMINIIKDVYTYLFVQFKRYSEVSQSEASFSNFVQNFRKQCEYLFLDISVYQPNKQKEFFLCLEQTIVFRQRSSLLKIKNNSILDLIKTNQTNLNKFKQCKKKDVEAVLSYVKQKKQKNANLQKVKEKEKDLQANIMNLFKQLGRRQTQKNQTMIVQGQQSSNRVQGLIKDQQKVKITYKHKQKFHPNFFLSVKKINPLLPEIKIDQNQPKKQETPEMQYIIEYSSDRNSICVRLILNNILVHIENSDFLMYQSNILTFETVNVNIQLVETVTETKKNIKRLAFKGTSCLNSKQPPLQKILLLMDATMVAKVICEPEFDIRKVVQSSTNDHERLTLITNKINHYTRIFLKCAKKVYSE